jgi:hypothetical protein
MAQASKIKEIVPTEISSMKISAPVRLRPIVGIQAALVKA